MYIYEYIIHKCGQNLLKMGSRYQRFYPKNDQIPFRPRNIILKYRLYCILPALQHGFNKEINRLEPIFVCKFDDTYVLYINKYGNFYLKKSKN